MKQVRQTTSFDDLWKALEAERHDISYRKPVRQPEVHVVIKEVRRVPERLKKIYFNAGRYAAGDRDKLAIEANEKLEKIERADK